MGHYSTHFNNRQLAGVLSKLIQRTLSIDIENVVAFMMDRASNGTTAQKTLAAMFYNAAALNCLSHTMMHSGDHIIAEVGMPFVKLLLHLFSKSISAKEFWLHLAGKYLATASDTRWWTIFEVIVQLLDQWHNVSRFVSEAGLNDSELFRELGTMWHTNNHLIHFQLVCIAAAAKPYVESTYQLEGDGPTALEAYRIITKLDNVFVDQLNNMHYDVVRAAAKDLVERNMQPPVVVRRVRTSSRTNLLYMCALRMHVHSDGMRVLWCTYLRMCTVQNLMYYSIMVHAHELRCVLHMRKRLVLQQA